ncbi:MAG: hypothetical protein PW734_11040 [Verrucomicrobium sp.]|nr:hypothetical protein [Verrucomicrobium sp.]
MKFRLLLIPLLALVLAAAPGRAQYAVNDAVAQALIQQGNNNFLKQMATQLDTLNQQLTQLQTLQNQGQQMLTITGSPAAAIGFSSGSTGLGVPALTQNNLFQSIPTIAEGVNGTRSLSNTGSGVFQPIPTATPNGATISRDPTAYNKFDAYEQEFGNFQNILQSARSQRQSLLTQLQTVMNTAANTTAEQSEKTARINALSTQLRENDQTIRDASDQRAAQHEANSQDAEKQKQAKQDELNADFEQAQPTSDQNADAILSGIVNQTP